MAGSTACAHKFYGSFTSSRRAPVAAGLSLATDLTTAILPGANREFQKQLLFLTIKSHPKRRPLSVNASRTETGAALSGEANGTYLRDSESLPVARQWDERAASWVAQPALAGPPRKDAEYFDIPLNYYQVRTSSNCK
jgi:hypothetical protein